MAGKKAQMFVVTAVFMAGMIYAVQQALITYSLLDMSSPYRTEEIYIVRNVIDSINESIKSHPDSGFPLTDCQSFQQNLEELIPLLRDDVSDRGYRLSVNFNIDCSRWGNSYPNPAPLSVGISLIGDYDTEGLLKFYHR